MSVLVALEHQRRLPAHHRVLPLLTVGTARLLATLRPRQLRSVLELARCGARPATRQQAEAARRAVVAVSLRCAGRGCLQRSIAAALYCRAHGTWPTWCTGVRTNPFAAHAWIQIDDQPIGEPHPAGHYRTLLTIPPTSSPPRTVYNRLNRPARHGVFTPMCVALAFLTLRWLIGGTSDADVRS